MDNNRGKKMTVKKCEKCLYYQRKTWSQYYKPNNYHAIGFSHAYGYCKKHNQRCLEIKKCEVTETPDELERLCEEWG